MSTTISIRKTALAAMAALTLAACGGDDGVSPKTLTPELIDAKITALQTVADQPLLNAVMQSGPFLSRSRELQPAQIQKGLTSGLRRSMSAISAPTRVTAASYDFPADAKGHIYRQVDASNWTLRTGTVASNTVRLEFIDVNAGTGAVVGTVDMIDQSTTGVDKFHAVGTSASGAVVFDVTMTISNMTADGEDVAASGFIQNGDKRISFTQSEKMSTDTYSGTTSAPFIGYSFSESYTYNETTGDETGDVVLKLEGNTLKISELPISGGHDYTKVYVNGTLVAQADDLAADTDMYTPSGEPWSIEDNDITAAMVTVYMYVPYVSGLPYDLMMHLDSAYWSTAP